MDKVSTVSAEARECLTRDYKLSPKSKLIISITKVSQSGMTRRMKVFIVNKKTGGLLNITWQVSRLSDLSMNDDGLKIGGCGMDMTFWLADRISWDLFGKKRRAGYAGNGGSCMDWQAI